MRNGKKGFWTIVALIALTSAGLALIGASGEIQATPSGHHHAGDELVSVDAALVQDKILKGDSGRVGVAVTVSAARVRDAALPSRQAVDLVIVLDRSGSMQGDKIVAARHAVRQLIERLTPSDRLAVVTYSDEVQVIVPLTVVDQPRRSRIEAAIGLVTADGNTNLGGGLQQGIDLMLHSPDTGRLRKLILISDGLANQGVTDSFALGQMAAKATDHHFAVSTVGVGLDFNESLMTTIADRGTGRYYFLEDPMVFAQVFEKEFQEARHVVADGLELRIPLSDGVRLENAGGYPIESKAHEAVIRPGQLIGGQQRLLHLTFQVSTDTEREIPIGGLRVSYMNGGLRRTLAQTPQLKVACVANADEVIASMDKDAWSGQIVKEEYNRLKDEVAEAVRKGDAPSARRSIAEYAARTQTINTAVGSEVVANHLENDVKALSQSVADTFAGPPAAVAQKQKQTSKKLQYESYLERRDKK